MITDKVNKIKYFDNNFKVYTAIIYYNLESKGRKYYED